MTRSATERGATKTYGELRSSVLRLAKARNHFEYRRKSQEHGNFWDKISDDEYRRGYSDDYLKPNSSALCDMPLLSQSEFDDLLARAPR